MGLPDYSHNVEINHPSQSDYLLETTTKCVHKILCTPKTLLRQYFPCAPVKARLLTYQNLLMYVCAKPRCTLRYICDTTGNDNTSTARVVTMLIGLEYIKVIPRRTFVIPFNAYKIDKTYIITAKGKSVLHKLINY